MKSTQYYSETYQNQQANLFSEINEKSLVASGIRYKWGGAN